MDVPAESRTISRSRRRTRFRSTALPTCFDTVKPMRTPRSSPRARACSTNAPAEIREPLDAARKSARRFNRSMTIADGWSRSGTELLAAARPPCREHLAAACGRHPAAKAVAALAHQFARLIGPFHGICLRCARPDPRRSPGAVDTRKIVDCPRLARLIRKPSRPVNQSRRAVLFGSESRKNTGPIREVEIVPGATYFLCGLTRCRVRRIMGWLPGSGFAPPQRGLRE